MKLLATVFLCVFGVMATLAQVQPSVSVVGEAEMSISPDQVVFTFEVVTASKDLTTAKRANDSRSAGTLVTIRSFQIEPRDIQTDSLTITPQYTGAKDPRGERVLIGYEVTKRLFVTLRDLDKIDAFLGKVIEAGVNRVVAISIENSQIQKYREQVRAMAVKNAQAKARAYAQQLGQSIGKAYVIREEEADTPGYATGTGSGSGSGDGADWGDANGKIETPTNPFVSQVTFALGQITLSEKVFVTFDLIK